MSVICENDVYIIVNYGVENFEIWGMGDVDIEVCFVVRWVSYFFVMVVVVMGVVSIV